MAQRPTVTQMSRKFESHAFTPPHLFLVPPTRQQALDSAVVGFGRTGPPSRGLSPKCRTFFKALGSLAYLQAVDCSGGLPLLFLRWLSWTRTLPVITRTDTTLVDTMKNRVVAAADSTFQKSLRHCFLFVNKYVMIVFLFTKVSPLIGLIRRPKLSRIAQRIIHI